jgi:hypothetical protein
MRERATVGWREVWVVDTYVLIRYDQSEHFHILAAPPTQSDPLIAMSRSCIKHRLTPLTFLLCIRRKLRLPIYPNMTPCICGHHDQDIYSDQAFCCERISKKRKMSTQRHQYGFRWSPISRSCTSRIWYLYPTTPMAIEPLFRLRSDSAARPFDISFSPDPTSCHYCPYTSTIGSDTINITGPPPTPKTYQPEDILNTITDNADNNHQRHKRGKLGCVHKPSTHTTHFIHGDDVIGELFKKNMVLIPFTIEPCARFGPMLQAFLATTHHPHQKPWRTSHTNNKYDRPNANLMYERACPKR